MRMDWAGQSGARRAIPAGALTRSAISDEERLLVATLASEVHKLCAERGLVSLRLGFHRITSAVPRDGARAGHRGTATPERLATGAAGTALVWRGIAAACAIGGAGRYPQPRRFPNLESEPRACAVPGASRYCVGIPAASCSCSVPGASRHWPRRPQLLWRELAADQRADEYLRAAACWRWRARGAASLGWANDALTALEFINAEVDTQYLNYVAAQSCFTRFGTQAWAEETAGMVQRVALR